MSSNEIFSLQKRKRGKKKVRTIFNWFESYTFVDFQASQNLKRHLFFFSGCNKNCMGPFSALMSYCNSGAYIIVTVRNLRTIRGFLRGRLILFDKHWNLVRYFKII